MRYNALRVMTGPSRFVTAGENAMFRNQHFFVRYKHYVNNITFVMYVINTDRKNIQGLAISPLSQTKPQKNSKRRVPNSIFDFFSPQSTATATSAINGNFSFLIYPLCDGDSDDKTEPSSIEDEDEDFSLFDLLSAKMKPNTNLLTPLN